MVATNVPQPTFGASGYLAPAESAVLAGVLADINAAFGGNLNPALTTPQGQLASSIAAVIGHVNDLFLEYTNGVDPARATGRLQDAIGRIYFITRNAAQPTVLQVVCGGLAGVSIAAGALVQDNAGNLYSATGLGVIGASGTVTIGFACTVTGPVICAAQSLTIYQAVPGWDTAVTTTAGVSGSAVETAGAFELRRQTCVAGNALGTLGAIMGAVRQVANVSDAYVIDNPTAAAVTVGGISLPANSLYVAVVGGLAASVAQAVWLKKPPGCSYYPGNTTVSVADTVSGYAAPLPTYAVTFEIPTSVTILFAVTIANSVLVPATAAGQIGAAIASALVGGDGGPRARIGGTIYASRYYAPVAAVGSWVQIISILVGTATATLNDVTVPINQVPVTAASNVTVTLV